MNDIDPAVPARLSFSSQLPTLQLAWDSTSLGELKLCPQKYKYSILDGWEPRDTNVHLFFGIHYHRAFEIYNHCRADGKSFDQSVTEAMNYVLDVTWNRELNRPWPSDDPNKNRHTLIRSIIWYLEKFKNDPLETIILADGTPFIERSFRFELGVKFQSTKEDIILCGHIDRGVTHEKSTKWITDFKTTKYTLNGAYFARFSPDNQISLYSTAGDFIVSDDMAGLIIDAAQILVDSTVFHRGFVGRTASQKDEWMSDTWRWLQTAEFYAGNNHWPKNDKACGLPHLDPKTGEVRYGCPFREVCSSDPAIRENLLKANFAKRSWDPLRPREFDR